MCLPGTVEAVRESSSGVTRRAALAGGGAARARRARAGQRARRRPRQARPQPTGTAGGGTASPTSRTCSGRLPRVRGREAGAVPPAQLRPGRLLLAGLDVRRALQHPHGRPGHFIEGGRRTPDLQPEELFAPIA